MSVPLSFLLGMGAAFACSELVEWLPGEAQSLDLVIGIGFLALPVLWLALAGRSILAALGADRPPSRAARLLLRTAVLSVPLGSAAVVGLGGWHDLVERWAPDSNTARFACLLLPTTLLEFLFRFGIARLARRIAARGSELELQFESGTGPMVALVLVCALLLGAAMDLAALSSALEIFFGTTTLGSTLGLLVLVVAGSALLPLLFRVLLPTSTELPARIAGDLREVAARLGFRPSALLSLDTGLHMVNAALVGPLRWPRYLILSDGILAYLDAATLRGVVAHEIGHARAGHPLLIVLVILVVPILLLQPVMALDLDAVDPWLLIGGGAALATIALLGIRRLMHRFEYEADHLSARALGGATPCIAALLRVGELFPGHSFSASFRHPSEVDRVQTLVAHENDPDRSERFRRHGRTLRIGLLLLGLATLTLSAVAHAQVFASDMATQAFYSSRFDDAERWLAQVPAGEARETTLREDLEAALALRDELGVASATRSELADAAFARAITLAAGDTPARSRPYFALALAKPHDDPLRLSAWLWSDAVANGDAERGARIAAHLVEHFDAPPPLRDLMIRVRDGG